MYFLFLVILSRHSTQKTYNTYDVDLFTTRITQGRLTPTLGYKTYNAFSVELKCIINSIISCTNLRQMVACFAAFYTMKCLKSFYPSLSTTSPSPINPQIISSIFMTNYSPLSSENHRSLFVKPAKRGKQRAGGEVSFALHYFTFYYQPCHPHYCFISRLRWYCAIIPMDEFRNINALMVQLGTSCVFDSPGLARNEPTPGKHPQGDSTP